MAGRDKLCHDPRYELEGALGEYIYADKPDSELIWTEAEPTLGSRSSTKHLPAVVCLT